MNLVTFRPQYIEMKFRPDPNPVTMGTVIPSYRNLYAYTSAKTDSMTATVDVAYKSVEERDAEEQLKLLFDSIHYDNEMDTNELMAQLMTILQKYGDAVLDALDRMIAEASTPAWKIGEVLAMLGDVHHPSSYQRRRYLLLQSLFERRESVRDGAISGVAALGDRSAIPFLIAALSSETQPELEISLNKIIHWLQRE